MTEIKESIKAPWHLWIVGCIMTLWNAIGCFDYMMTQTQNEQYLAQYNIEQLDYFMQFPAWVDAAWACGVWGAILGSILLLFRSKLSYYVYIISLGGLIVSSLYHLTSGVTLDVVGGTAGLLFTGLLYVIAIGQLYYSKRMKDSGVIR